MTLEELTVAVREFAVERDWEQFHTPKNLAMAVAGEAGELAAELQWLTPEESQALRVGAGAGCRRGDGRRLDLPVPDGGCARCGSAGGGG